MEDEALYRLVRTSMDVPDNTTIDAAALSAYRDIVDAYLAQVPYGPTIVESSRRELLGFYQAAKREDLGAKIYCIDTVTIVEPAEKAPYLLAGGAYVDSQLRIHGDNESNLLVVVDGEPVGFVNWMWLELDNGLENCASKEDLIRIAQSFGGVVQTQQALPLEPYTGERSGSSYGQSTLYISGNNEAPYFVVSTGKAYALPLPYADASLRHADLLDPSLDAGEKTYSYKVTVPEHVLASDGSVLSRAGTYHYTVDLNALTYTVRIVTADTELPYAPQTFVTALLQMEDVGDLLDDFAPSTIYYDLDTYEDTDTDPLSCYVYYELTRPQFAAFREAFEARTGGAPDADTSWITGAWNETGGDGRDIAYIAVSGTRSRAEIARLAAAAGGNVTEYAPTGVVMPEISALLGTWSLDSAYSEAANGIAMQELFGTALERYGAGLRVENDRSINFNIGVLYGEGTWQPDGDTGRYEATVTLSPDGGEKHLTFYVFRQSGESVKYLAMDYGECMLFWTQRIAKEEHIPSEPPTEDDIHAALMAHHPVEAPEGAEYVYPTEAHHILSIEDSDKEGSPVCTVYAYVNFSSFEWYGGRQKWIHPSYVVPVEMVFRWGGADYWHLTDFWFASPDDTDYESSVRARFPATVADWVLGEINSDFFAELNTRAYESAAAYYATLSGLPEPKVYTPADVNFTGQALNFKEADTLTYEERLAWVQSGAADSENSAYVSLAEYLEGNGLLAYLCQWVGTPHVAQYVFNLRFADGSTALLPLPRDGFYASALPDSTEFRDGKFIYEKYFTDDLFVSEGETLIHLKGTYRYEVDLAAKTVSLTVIQ